MGAYINSENTSQNCFGHASQYLQNLNINITEDKLRFIAYMVLFTYALACLMAGNKGILSYVGMHSELKIAEERLATLNIEQSLMRHRVARLRSNSVDPDMADEQARLLLSYAEPGEIVVLLEHDGTVPQMQLRQAAIQSNIR